ncbi:phage tail protein [Acidovorax radicis]|uniref:phage tail protein n=1 Tax=Acidovorax radicis TaxID=758826 RepID=UPI001CFC1642|nr:tail fiber protein [Acidovorax radicis]UCV01067.1 tail fiber protein [Acidovorax radicis]
MAHPAPSQPSRRLPIWRHLAIHGACGLSMLAACAAARADSYPFVGALMPMAGLSSGSSCPNGWLAAEGQVLPIQTNTTLYSLLGTAYGGNGTTTFALPDLRGRVAVGMGQGPGLSALNQGENGGNTNTTLSSANLPMHQHGLATNATATHTTPGPGRTLAQAQNAGIYANSGNATTLAQSLPVGQNAPIPTMSPYLVINWCIAITGDFPQRP